VPPFEPSSKSDTHEDLPSSKLSSPSDVEIPLARQTPGHGSPQSLTVQSISDSEYDPEPEPTCFKDSFMNVVSQKKYAQATKTKPTIIPEHEPKTITIDAPAGYLQHLREKIAGKPWKPSGGVFGSPQTFLGKKNEKDTINLLKDYSAKVPTVHHAKNKKPCELPATETPNRSSSTKKKDQPLRSTSPTLFSPIYPDPNRPKTPAKPTPKTLPSKKKILEKPSPEFNNTGKSTITSFEEIPIGKFSKKISKERYARDQVPKISDNKNPFGLMLPAKLILISPENGNSVIA
jgi:hypothetical protein